MNKQIGIRELKEYQSGKNVCFKDGDIVSVKEKKSENDIAYYDWSIRFVEDIDAYKAGNTGIDEIQVIFNLNQDIVWNVEKAKTDLSFEKIIDMKKGEACIYRNNNISTSMNYKGGVNFRFKSLQMGIDKFYELTDKYFKNEKKNEIQAILGGHILKTWITPDMYRLLSEIDSNDRFNTFKSVFLETRMIELTMLVLNGTDCRENVGESHFKNIDLTDVKKIEDLREKIQLTPYVEYVAEEMAESLNMSLSKMNRIFRSLYGTSLHAYVCRQRLEYAAGILMNEDCSVTEAAIKSGYNNMSHFSKSFAAVFGITPKKFCERKVLKND